MAFIFNPNNKKGVFMIPSGATKSPTPTPPSFTNKYSLNFDGVDDFVDCGVPSNINSLPNLSISCWFKTTTTTTSNIIGSDTGSWDRRFLLQALSSSGMKVRLLYFKTPSTFGTIQSTTNINDGNWHHVLAVNNGTNMFLYLDGILESSNSDGGIIQTAVNVPLNIGRRAYLGVYGNFAGNIDEVAIWGTDQSANIATLSTAPTVDLTPLNPIAWYRMGDNGAYKDPQWLIPSNENKDKVSNYSFDFDGVDDYIDCGNPASLQITGALTVSFWFKSGVGGTTGQSTITKDTLGLRCWGIWTNDYGAPTNIAFSIFNSNVAYGASSASDYNDGNWHNVICIFTPSTSVQIYVDGILDGSNTTSIPATIDNDVANVIIGGTLSSGAPIYQFSGNIDEVAIFNSALSGADITTIYNSGVPSDISSLSPVGYWRSENSTFSTNWIVTDNGSGSNDGTSANMTIEDRLGEAPNSSNNAVSLNMDEVDRETDVPT